MHCPPLPKEWIDAMRSGERVMQKARRGFPPGLPAQLCQIALSHTSRVTKSTNFQMFAPPPAILEGSQKQQQTKRLIWLRDSCIQSHSPKLRIDGRKEEFSRTSFEHDGGSCRGGFQTLPRSAFTVCPLIRRSFYQLSVRG